MTKQFTLYNGLDIPVVGFGTWQIPPGEQAYTSVANALKVGYRHVDTAYAYGNEADVGRAIAQSGLEPKDVFVTTKLPAEVKTYQGAMEHFEASFKNLGLNKIDLYLIHAPWPWANIGQDCTQGNIEAWRALIDIYNQGKVGAIGVSNFAVKDIEALVQATGFKPMVNQIRFFVGNTQEPLTAYCHENCILVEAYSPLATGKILQDEALVKLAAKYGTSPAAVCLSYCLERGTLPLPKSVNEDRIKANFEAIYSLSLAGEDIATLDAIVTRDELKRPLRS